LVAAGLLRETSVANSRTGHLPPGPKKQKRAAPWRQPLTRPLGIGNSVWSSSFRLRSWQA